MIDCLVHTGRNGGGTVTRRSDAEGSPADADTPLITALRAVLERHGRWGFWKCFERFRALGHGWTSSFRMYYGPKFIADAMRTWCETHGITLAHIEPGKPNQNAFIVRFNGSFREEVLDTWVFTTLAEARAVSDDWRHGYNTERSHESHGNVPPLIFLPRPTNATPTNFKLCA